MTDPDWIARPFPGLQLMREGAVLVVTINRPERRNAVDLPTARALHACFKAFDGDEQLAVAVLTGANGHFCAGADLKALPDENSRERVRTGDFGPMGPTRLVLGKPVIAAVEGYAVAGGLELAIWCDLRVVGEEAVFGVFCRRFGVPLIDGGTVRLPRLIGHGRAMDMILTGRSVDAREALTIGLASRLVPRGQALTEAIALGRALARYPQTCLRHDRLSAIQQWALSEKDALLNEYRLGCETLASGEALQGAMAFQAGHGRHGDDRDADRLSGREKETPSDRRMRRPL